MTKARLAQALGAFALLVLGCSDRQTTSTPTDTGGMLTVGEEGKGGDTGSPKVDSFNNDTCGGVCTADYEDNTIAPGETQIVWINQASANACGSFSYSIVDNPNHDVLVGCDTLSLIGSGCSEGSLQPYSFFAPAAGYNSTSQSATMTVYCGGGCNPRSVVGGDSFRLVDNGDCTK